MVQTAKERIVAAAPNQGVIRRCCIDSAVTEGKSECL